MKMLSVLLLILATTAQQITDLGVLTDRRGLVIDGATNRTDLVKFWVEVVVADGPPFHFGSFYLNGTNGSAFLTSKELQDYPTTRLILGICSIYEDGQRSEPTMVMVDLQRDNNPRPPTVRPIVIGGDEMKPRSTVEIVRGMTNEPPPPGPIPSGLIYHTYPNVTIDRYPPLPNATNENYSNSVKRMLDIHERRRLRRSE